MKKKMLLWLISAGVAVGAEVPTAEFNPGLSGPVFQVATGDGELFYLDGGNTVVRMDRSGKRIGTLHYEERVLGMRVHDREVWALSGRPPKLSRRGRAGLTATIPSSWENEWLVGFGMFGPNPVAVTSDGTILYGDSVLERGSRKVMRAQVVPMKDGFAVLEYGSENTRIRIGNPNGVRVLDINYPEVERVKAGYVQEIGVVSGNVNPLVFFGIAADDDHVYLAMSGFPRTSGVPVLKVDGTGKVVDEIRLAMPEGFRPRHIALLEGVLYLVDGGNGRTLRYGGKDE